MTRNRTIRFADLECLLLRLGFQRSETVGVRLVYTHSGVASLLVFPPYKPDEIVQTHHWMKTRWELDSHGLMESEAFDHTFSSDAEQADCVPVV